MDREGEGRLAATFGATGVRAPRPRTRALRGLLACLAAALVWPLAAAPALDQAACTIEHAGKLGLGVYPLAGNRKLDADLDLLEVPWFYNWGLRPGGRAAGHVPMVWSGADVPRAARARGDVLLTFNEPDHRGQSNMTVEEALSHWPALMATGKRLSSPAPATGQELGSESWLGRFMAEVERRGYRVDFIAVHYYPTEPDVAAFRRYLERVHQAYGRPIWVTEWALADWSDPGRFTPDEQRRFFESGSEMLDDLPYVERHAWFGIYEGLDGWRLGSGMIDAAGPTPVGKAYRQLVVCGRN